LLGFFLEGDTDAAALVLLLALALDDGTDSKPSKPLGTLQRACPYSPQHMQHTASSSRGRIDSTARGARQRVAVCELEPQVEQSSATPLLSV
jgi:hypothetical protein